ncbi:MAG: hypothetical protein JSV82_00235 [Planctomycetota bacterium]|nr:MAG: hypothetical protein JSV82_00235 [Planctomycetota bacterium]
MPAKLKTTLRNGRVSRQRSKGLTIMEVVVASMLLAVAMIPVLKALTAAHAVDIKIEERTRSFVLARAKLDEIRARALYSFSTDFEDPSSSVDGDYLCKVDGFPVDSRLQEVLKDIQVSVGYDDNNNSILEDSEIEVTLRTLLAKREP